MDQLLKTKAQTGSPISSLMAPGEYPSADTAAIMLINSQQDIEDLEPALALRGQELWGLQLWVVRQDGSRVSANVCLEPVPPLPGLSSADLPPHLIAVVSAAEYQVSVSFDQDPDPELKAAAGKLLYAVSPKSRAVMYQGKVFDISAIYPDAPLAIRAGGLPVPADATSPIIAGLVSLILPGVGQIMLGQTVKGAAILLGTLLTCALGGVVPVIAAVDAYLVADRKARGEDVAPWQFF